MKFREIFTESNTVLKEGSLKNLYKQAKKFLTGSNDVKFITPLYKGDKVIDTRKEYELFVDWNESAVGYNKSSGKWDTLGIDKQLEDWAIKIAQTDKKIKITESDDKYDWYGFISGVGSKYDVEDFIKNELNNRKYKYTKWDF